MHQKLFDSDGLEDLDKKQTIWIVLGIAVPLYFVLSIAAMFFGDKIPYGTQLNTVFDTASSGGDVSVIGEIVKGDVLQQEFAFESENPIHSIQVNGATYARKNKGMLNFRLIDQSGGCLKSWEIDMSNMTDNGPVILRMEGTQMPSGSYLMEVICTEGQAGRAATLYAISDKISTSGRFTVNGREQAGNLYFRVMEIAGRHNFLLTKIWLYVYAAALAELVFFWMYKNGKVQKGKRW